MATGGKKVMQKRNIQKEEESQTKELKGG